ncbi:MAG TPA: MoaD/ThiS family protein [Chloroflexota bacterium]|nr:MoaD/ThiS family protein [Chloroflexota bacterium]
MAVVFIPSLLRGLAGGAQTVTVPGTTLRQVIQNLDAQHPGIGERLLEDDRINPALSVVVDGVTARMGLRQPVGENSEVHFLPAISGG